MTAKDLGRERDLMTELADLRRQLTTARTALQTQAKDKAAVVATVHAVAVENSNLKAAIEYAQGITHKMATFLDAMASPPKGMADGAARQWAIARVYEAAALRTELREDAKAILAGQFPTVAP